MIAGQAVGEWDRGPGRSPAHSKAIIYQRVSGEWREVLSGACGLGDPYYAERIEGSLNGLSFSMDADGLWNGLAVGTQTIQREDPGDVTTLPYVLRYGPDRVWRYEKTPPFRIEEEASLRAVSEADSTHAMAVGNSGFVLTYGYGRSIGTGSMSDSPPIPVQPVLMPRDPAVRYFPEVGHTLSAPFRRRWEEMDGSTYLGPPLTEPFVEMSDTSGNYYLVQYFERGRLEYHPENAPPNDVQLGLLGRSAILGLEEGIYGQADLSTTPGAVYFPKTRHNVTPAFYKFWDTGGGLAVFGYPISEQFDELDPSTYRLRYVQYFERARLVCEYHETATDSCAISPAPLGKQELRHKGWLP